MALFGKPVLNAGLPFVSSSLDSGLCGSDSESVEQEVRSHKLVMGPSFRALVKVALNQLSLPTDMLIYTLCDEEADIEMHGLAQLDGLGLLLG